MIQVATTKVILSAEDLREYEEMKTNRMNANTQTGSFASDAQHGGKIQAQDQQQQQQMSAHELARAETQRRIGVKK
jgi:hypothetical protein